MSLFRLPFLFLLALYLYLGVIEIPEVVAASVNDLLVHAIGYAVLICAGFFAFPQRLYTLRLFLGLLVFSFMIEYIQYFLPYRSFSLLDLAANGLGLLLGVVIGWLLIPAFLKLQSRLNKSK